MVAARKPVSRTPRRPPATTPEGREKQMIALAVDLVEQKLRDGTATSQETVHYLRLATTRNQLEQEKLRNENELLKARVEAMASMKNVEELYGQALNAMRQYSGQTVDEDYDA